MYKYEIYIFHQITLKTDLLALVEGNVQGLVERLEVEVCDDELLVVVALHQDGGDLPFLAAGGFNASLQPKIQQMKYFTAMG